MADYLISQGANIHAYNDHALNLAVGLNNFEVIAYLIAAGASAPYLTEFHRRYAAVWARGQERLRIRAAKRIYFWWIQRCYEMPNPSGIRMAYRNLDEFETLCAS
jgi:hypothetical protein